MLAKPFPIAAALAATLFLSGTSSAHAEGLQWNGAGWYVTADNFGGVWLLNGPFADEASCRANVPADDDDAIYGCAYLRERPDLD
jgi:hypothetical protein